MTRPRRTDAVLYLCQKYFADAATVSARSAAISKAVALLNTLPDPVKRMQYADEIYSIYKKHIGKKKTWDEALTAAASQGDEETAAGPGAELFIPEGAKTDSYNPVDDYEKFGFFEWNNSYYKMIPAGEGKWNYKQFTNFSMKVLYHMDNGPIARRVVQLTNTRGRIVVVDTPTSSLSNKGRFIEFVESKGNFQFWGNDADLAKLKGKLYDEEMRCQEISVLGWNDAGFWAWSNGIFNGQFTGTDTNGFLQHDGVHYYVPAGNTSIANRKQLFNNESKFEHISAGATKTLQDWMQRYYRVFGDNGMVVGLFSIACIYSDIIYARKGCFPILFIYGEGGSGKGSAIKFAQHLFGRPQDPLTLSGKANTDKAKIRTFAQFVNSMILLEEYVPNHDTDQLLKNLFDRYGYKRGRMDQGYGTESVGISSGVAVTGNYAPVDDPLIQRLIFLQQSKNEFDAEEKRLFKELKDYSAEGITPVTHELLSHRQAIYTQFDPVSKEQYKQIAVSGGGGNVTDRMVENMNMIYTVYHILSSEGLAFPFNNNQLRGFLGATLGVQNEKRNLGSEVQRWWDILLQLINEGKAVHLRDFKIDGNMLYIRFSQLHASYLQAHAITHRTSGLNRTTMLDKLKHTPGYNGYMDACRIGRSNSSAFVFDMTKIEAPIYDAVLSYEEYRRKSEEERFGTLKDAPDRATPGSDAINRIAPSDDSSYSKDTLPF